VGPRARAAIAEATELTFSVVSFAEIGIKAAVGKLVIPADFREHVQATGVRILGLAPDHGLGVGGLPRHHRDPFDRLLISQARWEGTVLVTAEPRFAEYDVQTIDADA
jgi:PIN domain nuclease of toxin-antitoxin system